MKKQIVSTLLALCMLLCLMPTAAFAEGSTETQPVCSCETACTAENMNTACPVCGAEGALPENCAKHEVSDPQPETALTELIGGITGNPALITGSGTETDPYQISTADQLKLFRDIVNGAGGQAPNAAACAVLTANIDLNNEPWTPIGPDRDSAYTGTFDGQGHTVKNLSVTVNVQPCRAGLFGCVKDGSIRKLTVAGSVSCTVGQGWCGGIAGYAERETIENCASLCKVSNTGIDAKVGGIVGYVPISSSMTIIRDCYNIGNITGGIDNGGSYTGGICGFYLSGQIFNCYNVGEITGGNDIDKIAVYGYNQPTNCYYLSDTDTDTVPAGKTAAQFADGTVLKLLKAGKRTGADPWADECKYLDAAGKTLPMFTGQGDAHEHNGNWKSNGNGTHSRSCACGVAETKACTITPATCTEKAKCTVCGAEYGNALGHDFTTSWTHDDNEHWKQCSRCDAKDDVGPHDWDSGTITTASTCTKEGKKTYTCSVCHATKTEPIPATGHSWKSDWTSDATHHWHECANKNCDVTDNAGKYGYAEHSGGKATCKAKAVCEFCKASYGSLDPNSHADLKHIDAKAATAAAEGNIEYWYCDGCKKYFSDAAATKEITKAATVTAKLPPKITAGDGAAVTQGEKKELTFTSDASFADFLRVELDGTALEEKNYTKREGSTIITLNRDFVAALSAGEHTLAIVSQHGTATAKFTVKAKPAETATPQPTVTPQPQPTVQPVSPIPRTGDTANPALWFALLIVSGFALAAIFVLRRKDNRK